MRFISLCCTTISFLLACVGTAADRPNIIVILSDDMGYSDLGCYGSEIKTPNLDKLASGGVRFTQFYNTARCCPTRASLLTGLTPQQAGIGHMTDDKGVDSYRGDLSKRAVTFAEALKPAGYKSYVAGKWHVTKFTKPEGPKDNWPLQRGFDRFYGTIHGAGSFYDPSTLTRDNIQISPFADPEYKSDTYYYTDAISDHAVRFIKEHQKTSPEQPFIMYVAYTAAHWPMHALPQDIAKYKGKYDVGYEAIRKARFERMQQLGVLPPGCVLPPGVGEWESVKNKPWEAACMEVYAAMIDNMDQGIGRIISSLQETQRFDNTLILFMQDNGGCAENTGRKAGPKNPDTKPTAPTYPPIAANALLPSGSQPPQTRDGYPIMMGQVMPGGADTYIAYGEHWANVSNTPFRAYKHWTHEGGISTPLIAHWPKGIPPTRHHAIEKQPAHLIDIMATCIAISGASYPTTFSDHTIQPMEGVSLVPAFAGEDLKRGRPIFFEHEGNRAVRDGQWKIVSKHEKPWELYDIEQDRTELNDLAKKFPERVAEMSALYDTWANRVGALPWPVGKEAGKSKDKK